MVVGLPSSRWVKLGFTFESRELGVCRACVWSYMTVEVKRRASWRLIMISNPSTVVRSKVELSC